MVHARSEPELMLFRMSEAEGLKAVQRTEPKNSKDMML